MIYGILIAVAKTVPSLDVSQNEIGMIIASAGFVPGG
jgi:hypothetical protein